MPTTARAPAEPIPTTTLRLLVLKRLLTFTVDLLFGPDDPPAGESPCDVDSPMHESLMHSAWPALSPDAVVLFLDIDGVLHCAANESFERMPQLTWVLDQRPDLVLVLSTDWRLNCEPEFLRRRFPESVWRRVAGVTPHLKDCVPQREAECIAFATTRGVERYLAVDDDGSVFSSECPFLFQTNRYRALDWDAARSLLDVVHARFPRPERADGIGAA